jgi:hypothetical protein
VQTDNVSPSFLSVFSRLTRGWTAGFLMCPYVNGPTSAYALLRRWQQKFVLIGGIYPVLYLFGEKPAGHQFCMEAYLHPWPIILILYRSSNSKVTPTSTKIVPFQPYEYHHQQSNTMNPSCYNNADYQRDVNSLSPYNPSSPLAGHPLTRSCSIRSTAIWRVTPAERKAPTWICFN